MVKKLLIGGLLGGLAMFIWQGLWWAVGPVMMPQFKTLPEGESIAQSMAAQSMETGIYIHPGHPEQQDKAAWEHMTEVARRGPTMTFISYQAEGYDPMGVSWYVRGLVADIVACILVTFLVAGVAPCLPRYGQRVLLCGGIGLAGAITGAFIIGGFFIIPDTFVIGQVIDQIIGWLIAGLLIALATKPDARRAVASA